MRRLMFVVTAVCVALGSGVWWFFSPVLALLIAAGLLQLPLMLLVKRRLDAASKDAEMEGEP